MQKNIFTDLPTLFFSKPLQETNNIFLGLLGPSFEWLTCPDSSILQDDSVVDEADVLIWGDGPGSLASKQVQDSRRENRVLTVLNEFTQVGEPRFLRLGVLLDDHDNRIHDGTLVVKATLNTQKKQ